MEQTQSSMPAEARAQTMPIATALPTAPNLFSEAFSFYKAHWPLIFGITALPATLGILEAISQTTGLLAAIPILGFIGSIAFVLSQIGLIESIARDGNPEGGALGALKKGLKLIIPVLIVSAYGTFAAFGGILLLIIPGIILAMLFSQSFYTVIVDGRRGLSALALSWHYVSGFIGPVLWRLIFIGIVTMVIALPVMIITTGPIFFDMIQNGPKEGVEPPLWGSIVSILLDQFFLAPLGIIYTYGIYRALRGIKTGPLSSEAEQSIKKKIIAAIIFGVVGILALVAVFGLLIVYSASDFIKPVPQSTNTGEITARALGANLSSTPILNILRLGK